MEIYYVSGYFNQTENIDQPKQNYCRCLIRIKQSGTIQTETKVDG